LVPVNVKGLLYRDAKGDICETVDRPLIQNIDKIPFPARHLLPLDRYEHLGVSYLVYNVTPMDYESMERPLTSHLITSRGCYNRCTFCADHVIYKQKYRAHSPEYVIAEMKEAIKKFNIRIFNIIDPTFLVNQARVEKICGLILKNCLNIRWCCQGRVDRPLPVDLLLLMKKAGCMKIYYGIESGSPRMIREMKKNLKIANIRKAIANTKEAGMSHHVFFLYGFPNETMTDYYMTRQFIFELKPDNIEVHKVIPLPGTDLYARGAAEGCLAGRDWKDFHYYFKEGIFYKDECLQPDARKIHAKFFSLSKQFNMSPHYILTFIKRIKSIHYLKFVLKGIRVAIEYFAILNPSIRFRKRRHV
jgi:anaerobic magnesium-protoporphyrin IX monomethyl ester cyclase